MLIDSGMKSVGMDFGLLTFTDGVGGLTYCGNVYIQFSVRGFLVCDFVDSFCSWNCLYLVIRLTCFDVIAGNILSVRIY